MDRWHTGRAARYWGTAAVDFRACLLPFSDEGLCGGVGQVGSWAGQLMREAALAVTVEDLAFPTPPGSGRRLGSARRGNLGSSKIISVM